MTENLWLWIWGIAVAVVVAAILGSAWRYERKMTDYGKYLKRETERQNREDALLARQEKILERIEELLDRCVAEKELTPARREGITERPTKS